MQKALKIAEWKKQEVKDITSLIKKYPVLGIVDIINLPSLQLKRIRQQLKDSIFLKISKKRLIKIALNGLENKDFKLISEQITGMPALILSKENPFKLCRLLDKNKSSAPAKRGQIAPKDLIVQAGPIPFTPGPIISELGQLGIKTEVKEGKINIKEDKLLVRKGEEIKPKVADMLGKLGIEPMEVSLNLVLAYGNGTIFKKDVLAINEDVVINNIKKINSEALSLALHISYITKETIKLLLKKAYLDSGKLAKFKSISIPKEEVKQEEKPKEIKPVEKEEIKLEEKPREKVEEEKKADKEPKKEKKPLKYFKEKGPSSAEILREVEEEIKTEQGEFDKKDEKVDEEMKDMEEVEKIVQDLKDKKIKGGKIR